MRMTKKILRFFTIADWEKEENYLRKMHQEGWKLKKGGIIYNFERCEAEDVIYQLDYNQEGRKDKRSYVQMFEDCGWEYIQDFAGYSYFRKAKKAMGENEEAIFCDNISRLEMVRRVIRGRMIPLLILFLFVLLPEMLWHVYPMNGNWLVTFVLGCMVGLYAVVFVTLSIKFWRLSQRT